MAYFHMSEAVHGGGGGGGKLDKIFAMFDLLVDAVVFSKLVAALGILFFTWSKPFLTSFFSKLTSVTF